VADASVRQLGLLWGGAALLLLALAPFGPWLAAALPPCPFLALTGLPCAACGTTRAALSLAEGRPLAALAVNPLAALGWGAAVAGGLAALLLRLAGRPLPLLPGWPHRWRWPLAVALVANWFYLVARHLTAR